MNRFLVEPSNYKRIFSYVVDFLLVMVIGIILFATLGLNVINPALGGKEASKNIESFAVDSGLTYKNEAAGPSLFIYNEEGKEDKKNGYISTPNGERGYEAYLDKVWYYYTEFLNVEKNPDERVVGREGYTSSDYYKYAYEKVFKFTEDTCGENQYFTYKVVAGVIDYTAKPVLNENYQQKVDISDKTALNSLLRYFYNKENGNYSGLYYDAIIDMEGTYFSKTSVQTYYYEELTKESLSMWATTAICFMPLGLVFLFIIPVCSKKGQSLGKLIFKTVVVDDRGFYINWSQRILRPLLVTILTAFLLIPNSVFGFGLYFLISTVSFMMMTLGRKRQNIHERITHTIVVDERKSVIFNNIVDRAEYLAENDLDEYGNPNKVVSKQEGEPTVILTKEE